MAALLLSAGAYAQYFGVNFYKEGFESETDLAKWTVNTELAPTKETTKLWVLSSSDFSDIDATSTQSVMLEIPEGERVITSLTSPVIDTAGKSNMFAGIYGEDAFSNNYGWLGLHVYFEIKEESTDTWEILYESPNSCYDTDTWSWKEARKQLDTKYNGKKVRLRIRLRCDDESGCGNDKTLRFDGVYLSENYAQEAMVTTLAPNADVYGSAPIPVVIGVKNNGSAAMTSYKVAYSINGGAEVVQDVNTLLNPGQETTVTFDTPADFTEHGKEYTLVGKVILDGDGVEDNNSMEVTFSNILADLPYKHEITSRTDTDHWYTHKDDDTCSEWFLHRDLYWTQQVYSNAANNGRLLSRPIYLQKGQNICASYTIWATTSDEAPNLEVYYTKYDDRADASKGTLLAKYEKLSTSKTKDKVSFVVPEDGIYSIMFYNKPVPNGACSAVNGFSIEMTPDYDGALLKFVSPKANKDEFTNAETVTVTISNNGLKEMSGAKIRLSLDGNALVTENLPAIAAETQSDYTFAQKVDMLNGQKHSMKAELIWDLDTDQSNNVLEGQFVADLASPPYSIDAYSTDFKTHWEFTDNNNDGHTFEFEEIWGNERLAYNPNNETVATTDETLYARTLRLTEGKTYKASSRLSIWAVDGVEQTFDAAIDLYSVDADGKRTFVKNVSPKTTYSSEDGTFTIGFDVPSTGKYSLAFHITKDTETKTKFVLNGLKVEESGDVEMILSSVNLPGTILSGYNTLPYSIRVNNNGLKAIDAAKLKVSSETLGEKTEDITFEEPLKPGDSKTVKMAMLQLDITADETVTFELVADGDVLPTNNIKTIDFKYKAPATLPTEINTDKTSGWLTIDNDGNLKAPEYYSYYGNYDMSSGSIGDWLVSPTFNIAKDTPYHISWSMDLRSFDNTDKVMDVYLLNTADGSKTLCTSVVFDKDNTPGGYNSFPMEAYAQVDTDGLYALVFEHQCGLKGYYPTFNVGGPVKIEAITTAPDMKMTAITAPVEAAVYEEPTTVTATYTNAGTVAIKGLNFSLKAGENTYYAYIDGEIEPAAEGTVTFNNVDLTAPGEYALEATAIVGADATPADNTVSSTVMSNFIYNVNVLSIDAPDNGPLGAHEHVVVSIKNEGHGALVDTPINMTITGKANTTPVVVNETIPGPIAEGETLQYTFTSESDFSVDDTYTVTVSVKLEGDITPDNDSFTASIVSTHEDMDAGVTAIVGPTDRRMTEEENVIIKVKNYSNIDIYRVPVKATITRGEEEIATVTGVVPEIATGAEVEYTFPTAVNLLHGGEYTVNATTTMPNDVDATNDSFVGTIYAFIKDCGVSRIISPEASTVEGRQDITIEIKNYGDVAISNIPVYFKLGTNPQAEVYEGEIAPGETAEYTFKSQYNFRAGREYTLTAYTGHTEDENADNDSCELKISPTSGIGNIYANGAIAISTKDNTIVVTTEVAEGMIEVYNAAGLKVADRAINSDATEVAVSSGIYVVRVISGEASATAKVNVR